MSNRSYILDSLKGLAMIFVIVTHFAWKTAARKVFGFPFWIGMAVPVFMFASGYANAASMDKHGIKTFAQAYEPKQLVKKLLRFIVPYLIVAFVEIITHKSIKFSDAFDFITFIFKGAKGPGGYYVALMLQFVFVFPAFYFILAHNPKRGIIIAFVFNFLYELFCSIHRMSNSSYSQLIFRFTFIIAFGVFLYLYKEKVHILWYIAAFAAGTVFLIGITYFDFESKIITNKYWRAVSMYAVLYAVPFLALAVRRFGNLRILPLEWIGKRTYNIFLIQMLIYSETDAPLQRFIPNKLIQNAVILIICIGVGALFHFTETRLSGKCGKFFERKLSKLPAK